MRLTGVASSRPTQTLHRTGENGFGRGTRRIAFDATVGITVGERPRMSKKRGTQRVSLIPFRAVYSVPLCPFQKRVGDGIVINRTTRLSGEGLEAHGLCI